jgi:hypothetical protein
VTITFNLEENKIYKAAIEAPTDVDAVKNLVASHPQEAAELIVALAPLAHLVAVPGGSTGNRDERFYILGAPFPHRTGQIKLYKDALGRRFLGGRLQDGVDFLHGVFDRLLNKAIGLLAFCGLLLTAFGVLAERLPEGVRTSPYGYFGALLPLAAALPCLFMFFMHWAAAKTYETDASDFEAMFFSVLWRTRLIAISVWLVLADILVMSWLISVWLHTHPPLPPAAC